MKILGVDPGVHGGLAIVAIWLATHRPHHALIERAQAMPKQGASIGFKYGRAVGAIEGVIACCEIPPGFLEGMVERTADGDVASEAQQVWLLKVYRRLGGKL